MGARHYQCGKLGKEKRKGSFFSFLTVEVIVENFKAPIIVENFKAPIMILPHFFFNYVFFFQNIALN